MKVGRAFLNSEEVSLISATIGEHGSQLRVVEAVRSYAEVSLRSADS